MIRNHNDQCRSARLNPWFVVFEGIDGCGKTLQAEMLAGTLTNEGFRVLLTAEPSEGPIGMKIRSLDVRPAPEEEAQLFTEDRRDHVKRVILPALKEGRIVICDRYVYSSVAYQGARGIEPSSIIAKNQPFALQPDLIFLIEVPVEIALRRIRVGRAGGFSSYEERASLEAVDRIYRGLKDSAIRRIDGTDSPESIHETIVKLFYDLMSNENGSRNCMRWLREIRNEP